MIALIISSLSYRAFLYVWIALALFIFFLLLRIPAPYGRHISSKWGPLVSNRLGWFIMEFPVLIVLGVVVFPFIHLLSTASLVMIGLFFIHYFNRVFIFPFRLHTKGKKIPWVIVVSGIFFNLVSGFSLGYYFTHYANYTSVWFTDIRFITGTVLFFTGMYINRKADDILIHLRKPDEIHYVIPEKWLFNYISCPNLFGELVEWLGFAILCWNLPALGFFIWTAANLIPRAVSHHKWYKKKFINYPCRRKAILPFVV
jgi:3-oxo-5-alpha-steroid 4-dehydrogenase 1